MLECMKGGQMVTHPCAPLPNIEFFIQSPSPSPEPDTLPLLRPLMNERWWLSRVQSLGTPRRSPQGLLRGGNSP